MARKVTAVQQNATNIGACKIMLARVQKALEAMEAREGVHWGHVGDSRAIAESLAVLVRQAEGGDAGDDYGREILAGLGVE